MLFNYFYMYGKYCFKEPNEVKEVSDSITVCRKCRSELGRGKSHQCTEAQAVANLTKQALQVGQSFGNEDSKAYQRISTNLIKAAENKENIPRGEKMMMATGITFKDRERERERKRERERERDR